MCKRRKTFIFLAKKTVHLRPPAAVVKANLIKLNMKPSIKQVKKWLLPQIIQTSSKTLLYNLKNIIRHLMSCYGKNNYGTHTFVDHKQRNQHYNKYKQKSIPMQIHDASSGNVHNRNVVALS